MNCVQSAFLLLVNVRRFCYSMLSCRILIVVVMAKWSDDRVGVELSTITDCIVC